MNQRNRLIMNVASNYAAFFVYGVCNFAIVWYAGQKIGAEGFGLMSLVLSLAMVANILIAGICQSLTKHLAAELSQNNLDKINSLINTSLIFFTICAIPGFIVLCFVSIYMDRLFDIPPQFITTAQIAMFLMALKILFVFPSTTFQGTLWALQRYDLTNMARIVSNIFRLLGVIVYFELVRPGVIEIVVITFLGLLLERIIWIVYTIRLLPQMQFGRSFVSKKTLVILLGFGGLIFVTYVANLVGYEAIKWIIGSKMSVVDVGGYSVIATLVVFSANLVRAIANVLMPAASTLHAQARKGDIQRLMFISTKYAMMVSTGLCILPIVLLKPFLVFWVGKIYTLDYLHTLSLCGIVLLVGQWFITIPLCLRQIMTGTGNVKVPAFITMGWAISGLAAVWCVLHFGNPTLLIVVIIITVARIVGAIVHLAYGLTVSEIKPFGFILRAIMIPGIIGVAGCALLLMMHTFMDYSTMAGFLLGACVITVVYAIASWLWILDPYERSSTLRRLRTLFHRKSVNPLI